MTFSKTQPETHSTDRPPGLPGEFAVRVRPDRDTVYVIPVGELDIATTPRLAQEIEDLITAGFERLVVDLRELEFVDSIGLALLINVQAMAQRDGWELSLIQGPRGVRRLFELTGTLDRLPFAPDSANRRGPAAGSDRLRIVRARR